MTPPTDPPVTPATAALSPRRRLVAAMNWMGGLSLLLFWLPVVGPLVAGLVGGHKAGTVSRAVAAVFLPAVLTGLLAAAGIAYLTRTWFWSLLAGIGGVWVSLLNFVPLLAGAVLGGLVAQLRERQRPAA
jgi:hypothetical protein